MLQGDAAGGDAPALAAEPPARGKSVIDAVPSGGVVRFITRSNPVELKPLARLSLTAEAIEPRLEDGFMTLLKEDVQEQGGPAVQTAAASSGQMGTFRNARGWLRLWRSRCTTSCAGSATSPPSRTPHSRCAEERSSVCSGQTARARRRRSACSAAFCRRRAARSPSPASICARPASRHARRSAMSRRNSRFTAASPFMRTCGFRRCLRPLWRTSLRAHPGRPAGISPAGRGGPCGWQPAGRLQAAPFDGRCAHPRAGDPVPR